MSLYIHCTSTCVLLLLFAGLFSSSWGIWYRLGDSSILWSRLSYRTVLWTNSSDFTISITWYVSSMNIRASSSTNYNFVRSYTDSYSVKVYRVSL